MTARYQRDGVGPTNSQRLFKFVEVPVPGLPHEGCNHENSNEVWFEFRSHHTQSVFDSRACMPGAGADGLALLPDLQGIRDFDVATCSVAWPIEFWTDPLQPTQSLP